MARSAAQVHDSSLPAGGIRRRIRRRTSVVVGLFALILTTSPTVAHAASPLVTPIPWAIFTAGLPGDADAQRAGAILLNTNRYALTTWYGAKGFNSASQAAATYLTLGGIGEGSVRPPASEALALAVSLKTGIYNPTVTTVNTTRAHQVAAKLTRSLAHSHSVNLANGWGNAWQSGLWATYAGTAGWLLWDSPYLSATDRQDIRQMVEYEANRFIGYRVPYYRDRAGIILTPGDSKAEENAWNAGILALATVMMPNHANYDAWNYKAQELMVSSFATPRDLTNPELVNGTSVANWLNGSNANDDGALINHSRVHPDYMSTISLMNFAGLANGLAGKPAPDAAFYNSDLVYDALVDLPFAAGTSYPPGGLIAAPGGTIYIDNSPNIYYPQGNDWGTGRRMHFALSDIQARGFGFDNLATQNGNYWAALHAQVVLNMQNATPDRRTYTTAGQDTYSGREEWVAAQAAQTYLTYWLQHQRVLGRSSNSVPIVIDNLDRGFTVVGGTWVTSAPTGRLGANNRYAAAGDGSSIVRFTPRITTPGRYRVYAWWTQYPNHATNAPYVIRGSVGTSTVVTNQEINGGMWNLLGTFDFAAGSGGYVELSNRANEYVTADGVKFELVQ
jgi:hypothetical protein